MCTSICTVYIFFFFSSYLNFENNTSADRRDGGDGTNGSGSKEHLVACPLAGDLPGASFFFFFFPSWQPRKEGGLDLVIHLFFPLFLFGFLFGVRFRVDRDMDVCTYIRGGRMHVGLEGMRCFACWEETGDPRTCTE